MTDPMRILALWAMLHESADDAWKAAVARGRDGTSSDDEGGPDRFVDALAALVDEEKERLKDELVGGDASRTASAPGEDVAARLDALTFELAEVRGRLETLQASIDALVARPTE